MKPNVGSYFMVRSIVTTHEPGCSAQVELNADHEIFAGHFPGQPILPGVCQMEVISKILSQYLGIGCRLSSAASIKFLHMIDPRSMPILSVDIALVSKDKEQVKIKAKIEANNTVCLKSLCVFNLAD